MTMRSEREIKHGEYLAGEIPERVWGWDTPAGQVRAKRRAELIIEGGNIDLRSQVLEIGCGTGNFTEDFAKTGCDLLAVDISEALLKLASERNMSDHNVRFLQRRFEDCELEGPFDAIIGSSILHHLDLDDALIKIFQLLKPNGRLSFAEPNMLNPQVFIERMFRPLFPYVSPDETAFIRWNLKRKLQAVGFIDIHIVPLDWLHPGVPKKLINTIIFIEKICENTPFLQEFSGSLYINARRPN